MCGICGFVDWDESGAAPTDLSLLRSMQGTMEHRGPDAEGHRVFQGQRASTALGHRRLSIIDLSEAGRQPLGNEDGTVWVVLNGEIYNFPELRTGLESRGHVFHSATDTEVLVHLYEEEGEEMVSKLRGMFSFALWDVQREKLMLARDRLGQKPLFYASLPDNGLVFGSGLGALFQDPRLSREPDWAALDHYFSYQCIPCPFSAFKGIFKLPPAHLLVWEKGKCSLRPYWELRYGPKLEMSSEDAVLEFHRIFVEATRIRMVGDVPVGAFLSGGIDSAAVVAVMTEASRRPVRTFTIGFPEPEFDETAYGRQIAERFQTEHHELTVRPDAVDVIELLVSHFGEPFADSSAIPTFYVSQLARQKVKVVLTGDGGDEMFAGYDRYAAVRLSQCLRRWPLAMKILRLGGRHLAGGGETKSWRERLRRWLASAGLPVASQYAQIMSTFTEEEKGRLYREENLREQWSKNGRTSHLETLMSNLPEAKGELLDWLLHTDVMSYLPDDLLVKADITSMAHGLEARGPFLDHQLAEFAARLPLRLKGKGLSTKYFLKRYALTEMVPRAILGRRKMGFGVPVARWIRNELREDVADQLLDSTANGQLFHRDYVEELLQEHWRGRADHHKKLWTLLCHEIWRRRIRVLEQPVI